LFVFKILLVSLLAAMFINKYKTVFKNLDAHKRFTIIKLKNSIAYNQFIGGITITFFPINILILPFIIPVIMLRSKRVSDFLLKFQYTLMVLIYAFIAMVIIVPLTPILFFKIIVNSVYILMTNKREKYKGENVVQFILSLVVSPIVIPISILVDVLSLPTVLLKESKTFEHKYQQSENLLNAD
jgi:hypothetical protein